MANLSGLKKKKSAELKLSLADFPVGFLVKF
jgi:hypothetical protein